MMKKALTIILVIILAIIAFYFLNNKSESKIEFALHDAGIEWPEEVQRINEVDPLDVLKGDSISFEISCSAENIKTIFRIFDLNDSNLQKEGEYYKVLKSSFEPKYPWLLILKMVKENNLPKKISINLFKTYD